MALLPADSIKVIAESLGVRAPFMLLTCRQAQDLGLTRLDPEPLR